MYTYTDGMYRLNGLKIEFSIKEGNILKNYGALFDLKDKCLTNSYFNRELVIEALHRKGMPEDMDIKWLFE